MSLNPTHIPTLNIIHQQEQFFTEEALTNPSSPLPSLWRNRDVRGSSHISNSDELAAAKHQHGRLVIFLSLQDQDKEDQGGALLQYSVHQPSPPTVPHPPLRTIAPFLTTSGQPRAPPPSTAPQLKPGPASPTSPAPCGHSARGRTRRKSSPRPRGQGPALSRPLPEKDGPLAQRPRCVRAGCKRGA